MNIILLILFFQFGINQESRLLVSSGERVTIGSENQEIEIIEFDELILEDNSTLLINSNLKTVIIKARMFSAGSGSRIIGQSHADGEHGTSQENKAANGGRCRNGSAGQQGTQGGNGSDGLNIFLDVQIHRLDSLTIISDGGNGGNGGNGQNGGNGGQGSCSSNCGGGNGGPGGSGGNGGNGGNGGEVAVYFTLYNVDNSIFDEISFTPNIFINNDGGKGGIGGNGGNGGNGGGGSGECGPWPHWRRGSGGGGGQGGHGIDGKDGNKGHSKIQFGRLTNE